MQLPIRYFRGYLNQQNLLCSNISNENKESTISTIIRDKNKLSNSFECGGTRLLRVIDPSTGVLTAIKCKIKQTLF